MLCCLMLCLDLAVLLCSFNITDGWVKGSLQNLKFLGMLVIRIAVGICRDLRKVMHDYVNKGSKTRVKFFVFLKKLWVYQLCIIILFCLFCFRNLCYRLMCC
ncbi:unnamed protein product [Brassica rapa]|uniref:DUF577 domain-containing protein n=1 Tax=Brassica campestris TaxID=3711 RepID=A0A8D9LVA7_BRACM|nr:unnamed protein product [Brassica rapa]